MSQKIRQQIEKTWKTHENSYHRHSLLGSSAQLAQRLSSPSFEGIDLGFFLFFVLQCIPCQKLDPLSSGLSWSLVVVAEIPKTKAWNWTELSIQEIHDMSLLDPCNLVTSKHARHHAFDAPRSCDWFPWHLEKCRALRNRHASRSNSSRAMLEQKKCQQVIYVKLNLRTRYSSLCNLKQGTIQVPACLEPMFLRFVLLHNTRFSLVMKVALLYIDRNRPW